jgi:hypothetical protein
MMQEQVGVRKLAAHLGAIETTSIGLTEPPEKNRRVAQLLFAVLE